MEVVVEGMREKKIKQDFWVFRGRGAKKNKV